MAYVITKDHLSDNPDEPMFDNDVGTSGPVSYNGSIKTITTNGRYFRMYDDDGELYYSGYYFPHDANSNEFEPLECFGTPNAGATEIRMRNLKTNKYETV